METQREGGNTPLVPPTDARSTRINGRRAAGLSSAMATLAAP